VGVQGDGLIPARFALPDLDHGVIQNAELDDRGGWDGEVGADSYRLEGVELDGVESDMAESSLGARIGHLLDSLLQRGSRARR